MKHILFLSTIILSLLQPGGSHAQDTTVTWITEQGKSVSPSYAALYRHTWKSSDSTWVVRDYYLEGGLQMSGTFSNLEDQTKHGNFILYNKEGQKTSEGMYEAGNAVYTWMYWHDNGQLSDSGRYLGGISPQERDRLWKVLESNLNPLINQGAHLIQEGTWVYYHENGVKSGMVVYVNGKPTSLKYWDEDGSEVQPGAVVNRMPEFPRGEKALMRFLGSNIKYPAYAKKQNIQGDVMLGFTVDKVGQIIDAKVVEPLSPDLDNEALRVVETMPRWEPGIHHNRAVDVQYYLPIRFTLR